MEDKVREQMLKEVDLLKQQQLGDLKAVLNTPAGKRFIWWLLGRTNFFMVDFHGNSRDAFRAGERNIGSILFNAVIEVDPKLMGQMSQSHAAKLKLIRDRMEEKEDG